jgi:glucose/arabinose dehydrogenase
MPPGEDALRGVYAALAFTLLACAGTPAAGQDESLRLPPGFRISVFADQLDGVRYLALGPGNVVYASRPGAGVVVRLPDANADGRADSAVTVASGLDAPFGLAFRGDTMYVAGERTVKRFDPPPADAAAVTIVPRLPGGGHTTRTIVFGPDGKMYLSVGSSCNLCDESDSMRAAVLQLNPDGSAPRIFARGLRNSVGLAIHPTTGALWATNNDRDNLGEDVPPERINIVRDGAFYGWPQCYLPGERNPEYASADCSTVEPPAITFQAHSAPLGIAFYTGTAFPPGYRGDAFVALHGSWNRSVPTGAKVIRVQVENGRPVAVDDFVTGWQRPDGTRWGRPVGVVMTADGALLVSDDLGGKIWRVSYGN